MTDSTSETSKRAFSGRTIFIGMMSLIAGLLIVGYFGTGYYIFDILSNAPGGCQQPYMYDLQANQPDDFSARYRVDDALIDVSAYQMTRFEDVQFSSRDDNVRLAGFYIPAQVDSDKVVIIVHGINGCRREPTQLIPAGMLANNGFNVLVIDVRNHGDSEVDTGRMAAGNREFRDVLGAFDYLQARGFENDNIGLMGISLGAGTATIAFGQEPTLPALYLESPFSSIEEMVAHTFERDGYPLFLIQPTFQIAQFNGINFYEYSPDEAIRNHNNRPILMTHGASDERIPLEQAEDLLALAGNNADLVVMPELDHVQAIYVGGDSYAQRLITFFERNLGTP